MTPEGWMTLDVAAEASDVDVRTLRRWAAAGAMDIERQGLREVVRFDRVKFLNNAWRYPVGKSQKGSLRGLLGDATVVSRSVTGLQQLARERG